MQRRPASCRRIRVAVARSAPAYSIPGLDVVEATRREIAGSLDSNQWYEVKLKGRMVRKGGLEPPRSCERQPLKLVRLPIPPLPRGRLINGSVHQDTALQKAACYFLPGVAGAVGAGWLCGAFCNTELEVPLLAQIASVTEVTTKIKPSTQVIFASVVTAPRGPKAAWLEPPNAAAMSTFSPPWIRIMTINRMLASTWSIVTAKIMKNSFQARLRLRIKIKPPDN